MISLSGNKDQFGFYLVGDFKTYSKVEAMELSKASGQPIHWHFNDEIFSMFNWKIEPAETLLELYARRARQIREKYDYIVLFYSGGADSFNMTSAFLNNNLYIDEIAQFCNYQGDGTWNSYFNEEVKRVAIPMTEKILERTPTTKHRLIDLSEHIFTLFDVENKMDFIYKSNFVFTPNQLARTYLRERIKDYQDIINSGKKLCFVWGTEKPGIEVVDGKFCIRFRDQFDNAVGVRTQQLNRAWEHDEFFYWSADFPDAVCKQGHLLMKYLKNVPEQDYGTRWVIEEIVPEDEKLRLSQPGVKFAVDGRDPNRGYHFELHKNGKRYHLTPDGLHRIIYPTWDPNTFTNGKVSSLIFSPRDTWWRKDITQPHQRSFVNGMVKLIKDHYGTWMVCKPLAPGESFDFSTSKIKAIKSPPYFLE